MPLQLRNVRFRVSQPGSEKTYRSSLPSPCKVGNAGSAPAAINVPMFSAERHYVFALGMVA